MPLNFIFIGNNTILLFLEQKKNKINIINNFY